jgi:hypothetical protein
VPAETAVGLSAPSPRLRKASASGLSVPIPYADSQICHGERSRTTDRLTQTANHPTQGSWLFAFVPLQRGRHNCLEDGFCSSFFRRIAEKRRMSPAGAYALS